MSDECTATSGQLMSEPHCPTWLGGGCDGDVVVNEATDDELSCCDASALETWKKYCVPAISPAIVTEWLVVSAESSGLDVPSCAVGPYATWVEAGTSVVHVIVAPLFVGAAADLTDDRTGRGRGRGVDRRGPSAQLDVRVHVVGNEPSEAWFALSETIGLAQHLSRYFNDARAQRREQREPVLGARGHRDRRHGRGVPSRVRDRADDPLGQHRARVPGRVGVHADRDACRGRTRVDVDVDLADGPARGRGEGEGLGDAGGVVVDGRLDRRVADEHGRGCAHTAR